MNIFRLYIYIFLAFAAMCFTIGCGENNTIFASKSLLLKGQISQFSEGELILSNNSFLDISISNTGEIHQYLDIVPSGIYYIDYNHQKLPMFVHGLDTIILTTTRDSFLQAAKYEGQYANENNYLKVFASYLDTMSTELFIKYKNHLAGDFTSDMDSLKENLIEHKKEYQRINGYFDKDFAFFLTDQIKYSIADLYLTYYLRHWTDTSFVQKVDSSNFESFLTNIAIDKEDNLSVAAFRSFALHLVMYNAVTKSDTLAQQQDFDLHTWKAIDETFKNDKIRQILYHDVMAYIISRNISIGQVLMDDYLIKQKVSKFKKRIQKLYNIWSSSQNLDFINDIRFITNSDDSLTVQEICNNPNLYLFISPTGKTPKFSLNDIMVTLNYYFPKSICVGHLIHNPITEKNAYHFTSYQDIDVTYLPAFDVYTPTSIKSEFSNLDRGVLITLDGRVISHQLPPFDSWDFNFRLSQAHLKNKRKETNYNQNE